MPTKKELINQQLAEVTFELASGDKVKVALGHFWEKLKQSDIDLGQKPQLRLSLRIYSDEGSYPRRLSQVEELLPGYHFDAKNVSKYWRWLRHHAQSRSRFDHDCFDDFMLAFTTAMEKIDALGEDMVEHINKLPACTLPKNFDQYDDSWTHDNFHYINPTDS